MLLLWEAPSLVIWLDVYERWKTIGIAMNLAMCGKWVTRKFQYVWEVGGLVSHFHDAWMRSAFESALQIKTLNDDEQATRFDAHLSV